MRLLNRLKAKNSPKNIKKDDLGISETELFRRLGEKGCPVSSSYQKTSLQQTILKPCEICCRPATHMYGHAFDWDNRPWQGFPVYRYVNNNLLK